MEKITEAEVREWSADVGPATAHKAMGFYVGGGQCANPRCQCNTAGRLHGPLVPHFEK